MSIRTKNMSSRAFFHVIPNPAQQDEGSNIRYCVIPSETRDLTLATRQIPRSSR